MNLAYRWFRRAGTPHGDTAYGTAPMLSSMVEEKDIELPVPVWDKTERKNESFSGNDFLWDEEA